MSDTCGILGCYIISAHVHQSSTNEPPQRRKTLLELESELARVKEELALQKDTCHRIAVARDEYKYSCSELVKALEGIEIYQSDTLSGRIDGLEDRNWFRDGIKEILKRAKEALAKHRERVG